MMTRASALCLSAATILAALPLAMGQAAPPQRAAAGVNPAVLPAVGQVDERFQSYNLEMIALSGGEFWIPYAKVGAKPPTTAKEMFSYHEPIDLKGDRRLRTLAAALGPAYVRVSGAGANTSYFHDSDTPAPATPPPGFKSVVTRQQWAGLVDFAEAVDAKLLVSFPVSTGAREPEGRWNPDQARRLIRYTRSLGSQIDAAEMINEPNVGPRVGLPKGYNATRFAQDIADFRSLLQAEAPYIKTVGPGSTGEAGFMLFPQSFGQVPTEALMSAEPKPQFDIFSYHFYGTVSKRCSAMDKSAGTSADDALSEAWLARADQAFDYYKAHRDRSTPGAPIWITEIAQAACGGDPWSSTWLDTFRYVDQMARLAKRGTQVIFHQALSVGDYALLEQGTHEPLPSYWAALLWRKLMGRTVLDAGAIRPGLHVYAQCLRDKPGGVGLVAINLDKQAPAALKLPVAAQRYTLTADQLQSRTVKLNGKPLALLPGDRLPSLRPVAAAQGTVWLAPASINYFAVPKAANPSCR